MMKTIALTAAFIAALSWLGPAIDDHSADFDVVRAVEDAQRAAAARTRFERAAQGICGPQAAWEEVGNGVIQCFTRHGKPVGRKTRISQEAR